MQREEHNKYPLESKHLINILSKRYWKALPFYLTISYVFLMFGSEESNIVNLLCKTYVQSML